MKVFIAGPRIIKTLDEKIIEKLESIFNKKYTVLVGDANGIDSSVQQFFYKKKYKNVIVFASNGIARNNYGNWKIENVNVNNGLVGFEFYVQKDLEMAKNTDLGFMIWNGKSKGTFNNIINLLNLKKEVILYYLPNKHFYKFNKLDEFEAFLNSNVKLDNKLKKMLQPSNVNTFFQTCLF